MKTPTRSPTHADLELTRMASMGLEVEELADGDGDAEHVALLSLVELAEDRGRPASHYLAAMATSSDVKLAVTPSAPITVRVCAGSCQKWGALDNLDHLVERLQKSPTFSLAPVGCLDRCDQAAACEIHGPHGVLVLAAATPASLDEALDTLAQ